MSSCKRSSSKVSKHQPRCVELNSPLMQLIVAAELCRANAVGMPSEVLAAVVPSLVTLACLAPAPHSASAASCLAAGMSGRSADAWRLHLGNLQTLTERCVDRRNQLPCSHLFAICHTSDCGLHALHTVTVGRRRC